jgi:hypothetical protein
VVLFPKYRENGSEAAASSFRALVADSQSFFLF